MHRIKLFNVYTYSIYSLEIRNLKLVWSSRHPQHIDGFKLPERNPLLWTHVTIRSWRASGGQLVPSSERALQREISLKAPKLLCQPNQYWQVGMRGGFNPKLHKLHHCLRRSWSHPLKRTHLLGCSVSHNTFNPGLNHHLLMNCVAVFPKGTSPQNYYYQHVESQAAAVT